MKRVMCTIQGEHESGLLMNRYPMGVVGDISKKSMEEQLEIAAYRVPSQDNRGQLYIPSTAIQQCLVNAGAYAKGKGRGTLKKTVAACVFITPAYVLLQDENGKALFDYEVDTRSVVNPMTKGRLSRSRPLIPGGWKASLTIDYNPEFLKAEQLRTVVDYGGAMVGLLDFRPQNTGPFGRFKVVRWDAVREDDKEE